MIKQERIVERKLIVWTVLTLVLSITSFIASVVFWIQIPKTAFFAGVAICVTTLLKTPGCILDDEYLDPIFMMSFGSSLVSLWLLWAATFI